MVDEHTRDLLLVSEVLRLTQDKEAYRRQLEAERLQWGAEAARLQRHIAQLEAKIKGLETMQPHGEESALCGAHTT